MLSADCRKV